jgi:hypothetical protein
MKAPTHIIWAIIVLLSLTGIIAASDIPVTTAPIASGFDVTMPTAAVAAFTAPATFLHSVFARDDSNPVVPSTTPSLPEWRPVENAAIPRYDPRYHPGNIAQPIPPPPVYSPNPVPKKAGFVGHFHERYVKWAVRDRMATSLCEYNGFVVPCYPENRGYRPWYEELRPFKAAGYGLVSPVWNSLHDSLVWALDDYYMPNEVRDYREMAQRDSQALCHASYNGWRVPSRCGHPGPDFKPSNYTRFNVFPPKSKEPPKAHHYWGDPDSKEPSPYYPTKEQLAESYMARNNTCYHGKGTLGQHQGAPYDAVKRNIFESCEAMSDKAMNANATASHAVIPLLAHNIDKQLMNNTNWVTTSVYKADQDIFVETSVRLTADPLKLYRSTYAEGAPLVAITVESCTQRLYATVEECSETDGYGTGVAVWNEDMPILVEVKSTVVPAKDRPHVQYRKPYHPIKGEEAHFAPIVPDTTRPTATSQATILWPVQTGYLTLSNGNVMTYNFFHDEAVTRG